MAKVIKTQEGFRDYILRKLGAPVNNIELATAQLDDCIDDAVQQFYDSHDDSMDIGFVPFEITDDAEIEYTLDTDIQMVTEIYSDGTDFNFFPADSEPIAFTGSYFQNYDIISVEVFRQQYNLLKSQYSNPIIYDFNELTHKLIIPAPKIGKYMLRILKSPDIAEDIFNDLWLKKYATALAKKQWSINIGKFSGVQLPGGAEFNYGDISSQAEKEIEELLLELEEKYTMPPLPEFC